MSSEIERLWDKLIDLGVTEQTLQIATSGWGYTVDTLETVLYAHSGYRSLAQVEGEDEDDED